MSIELEFASSLKSRGATSINFLQLLLWQTQSSLTYKIDRNNASSRVLQSHATRHLSQAYKATAGKRVGNEVNLIRQATRFRALVNRETLLGQVPASLGAPEFKGQACFYRHFLRAIRTKKGMRKRGENFVRFYTYRFAWNRWDSPTVFGNGETSVLCSRSPA